MDELVNPYIAGAPVTETRMFFGREDVFDWIQNNLSGRYTDHILVIHGQRRVGKTSVLKQLGNRLPERYIPVFFDLQGRTHTTLDRFLWWLARETVRVLKQARNIEVPIPQKEDFARDIEYFENVFLPGLQPILGESSLLFTFDEFDNLEESEVKEELARPLIDHLRRMMGREEMNFIFSIGSSGRKLENMQASYTEFFKTALYKKISFLSEEQTSGLVTHPVEGLLEYDREAVKHIYELASGHPYFTQLTCHELFARCQRTDQRHVKDDDVNAVLDDVVERGTVNLKFTWDEASDIEKWGLAALAQLNKADNRILADYLRKQRVRFRDSDLTSGLLHLREKDILTSDNRFVIYFLKFWLQKNRPIEQVREELTEINPIANRYIEIGQEFKDTGLLDKAIESFQEAIAIAPENIQAHVNIALVYVEQKAFEKAATAFEEALGIDDEDVVARAGLCGVHLALGDVALAKGRLKDAIQSYQHVLDINREHLEARQRMAEISRQRAEKALARGKDEDALNAFSEALKFTPDDPNLIERVEQVSTEKKVKVMTTLIARADKDATTRNWEKALATLNNALEISPQNQSILEKIKSIKYWQLQDNLSTILARVEKAEKKGNWDSAIVGLKEYLVLNPGDENIKAHLSIVLERSKQTSHSYRNDTSIKKISRFVTIFLDRPYRKIKQIFSREVVDGIRVKKNHLHFPNKFIDTSKDIDGFLVPVPQKPTEKIDKSMQIEKKYDFPEHYEDSLKERPLNDIKQEIKVPKVTNPYIAGSPISEVSMFFAREDIFDWIKTNLHYQDADRIMVIYGQRRVGKTSVLKQLKNNLPKQYIPVYFDLQGSTHTNINHFLWRLANKITNVIANDFNIVISDPDIRDFKTNQEFFELQFVPYLLSKIGNRILFIAFDEFDSLEAEEVRDSLSYPLMDCLYRLMKQPKIDFLFSLGISTRNLEDTIASYAGFLKTAIYKKIDFFSENQTYQLITQPANGLLDYDEEAIKYIYSITNGHPYFTQLICHELFSSCQPESTKLNRISKGDVDGILESAIERGALNLNVLWNEASDLEKGCLVALAQMKEKTDKHALVDFLERKGVIFNEAHLKLSVQRLQERDILKTDNQFVVRLFGIWLEKNQHLEQVFAELDKTPITSGYIKQGQDSIGTKHYDRALKCFKAALKENPSNIEAHIGMGNVYFALEKLNDAEIEFKKVLALDDANKLALEGLTNVLNNRLESIEKENANRLRIFLCHSSLDKAVAYELYRRLFVMEFDPWLDKEKLLPGQNWKQEIEKAVKKADVIIILLSQNSTTRQGYIQKEIKLALDIADQQPENTIFLIPLRLEDCEVPERLNHLHWVDYFDERGWEKLLYALRKRVREKGY